VRTRTEEEVHETISNIGLAGEAFIVEFITESICLQKFTHSISGFVILLLRAASRQLSGLLRISLE
jgi:hypothetical protein